MGINNIPPKVCTYSCVYCQLGRTLRIESERTPFYEPHEIFDEAKSKVEKARQIGLRVDCLTFVPDGEPTLDLNLGRAIELLRPFFDAVEGLDEVQVETFPGADHGFTWPGYPNYHEVAAERCFVRTIASFESNLR